MLFGISAENILSFDYLECVGKIPRNTASHSLFTKIQQTKIAVMTSPNKNKSPNL